jgi:uridine kinase
MAEAPARLLAAATASAAPGLLPVIGVTGPVGAGKSTLARMLSGCVLSTDDYLPNYDVVPYHERDLPERMDAALLLENLRDLREGRPARVPTWSFQSHRREGYREIRPAAAVVCEGIHALHAPVAAGLDLRVYVEAAAGVRWRRWEHLEVTGVRGWGVEKARAFFHEVAEPTFGARAGAYRSAAHFVVVNEG